MSRVLDELEQWGCNVKDTLERLGDDESFYIECLIEFSSDPYLALLKNRLNLGDVSGAFDAAHTLKGVFANLGLTPMLYKVIEIVEPLRNNEKKDLSKQCEELIQMKLHLEEILGINK